MEENQELSEQGTRLTVWVIWVALLSTLGIYVMILRTAIPPEVKILNAAFPRSLGFVSLGIGIMSLVLRQIFLGKFKSGTLQLDTFLGRKRFVTGNVICFALAESIGVFGLILGFSGYPLDLCAKFLLGAVALMLWHMPLLSRFSPAT